MTHTTVTLDTDILLANGFCFDYAFCQSAELKETYRGIEVFIYREWPPAVFLEIGDADEHGERLTYFAENLAFADDDDKLLAFARAAIDAASI